jgi:hypothetical protein
MKDLTVNLEDRPGRLADLGEATENAGINIEGACGAQEGGGTVHVLVDDEATARSALGDAGFEIGQERDVLVVDIEDRPGSIGEVARRLGDAGVNVELVYTTFGEVRVVVGVDDIDKALRSVVVARYVELRRTDNDGDALTEKGVEDALEIGRTARQWACAAGLERAQRGDPDARLLSPA